MFDDATSILLLLALLVLVIPITSLCFAINASRKAEANRKAISRLEKGVSDICTYLKEQARLNAEAKKAKKAREAAHQAAAPAGTSGPSPVAASTDEETATAPDHEPTPIPEGEKSVFAKLIHQRNAGIDAASQATSPTSPNHPPAIPPPIPPETPEQAPATSDENAPSPVRAVTPPPLPEKEETNTTPKSTFSLEQFMGAKLFAWLGGVAMFFGVIFFVKYAFDHNLISERARVTLGFITGLALLSGGLWTHRHEKFRTLAHALMATGIVVLYGVSYAAHAYYRFEAFGTMQTFLLMSAITVTAFLLAVRFNAQVIAVLGMIGGFLSPILLPSVQDHTTILFLYIALLNTGILATSHQKPWFSLPAFAALGTLIIQLNWFACFFKSGHYDVGSKTLIPMLILAGFPALFTAGAWAIRKKHPHDIIAPFAAIALNSVAMLHAYYFLSLDTIATRPFLLYGFILALNLIAITVSGLSRHMASTHTGTAIATFIHLAAWTASQLKPELLNTALLLYLIFGAIHLSYPIIRQRLFPCTHTLPNAWINDIFGPAILLLMLLATGFIREAPVLFWAALMIANLMILAIAARSGRIIATAISIALTFLIIGKWLDQMPHEPARELPFLGLIVAFTALFTAAGFWLSKLHPSTNSNDANTGRSLPLMTALLPFGLLVMALERLMPPNPSAIFSVGLLLGLLLLGLSVIGRMPWLTLIASLCILGLQSVWDHVPSSSDHNRWITLGWITGFHALFTLWPLLHRRFDKESTWPWIAACASAGGHFLLSLDLAHDHFAKPMEDAMGLIPLAFAIPCFALLWLNHKNRCENQAAAMRQLAWLGGTTLLFITLIFPIHFERQWITVSWALEGAALIWLYRRIPHPGLKWTALGLLAIVFSRLAINPEILDYHPRGPSIILNWYLYAYGIAITSLILAAKLLPIEERQHRNIPLAGILQGAAGILMFILLNIQIADAFTKPGEYLELRFSNDFARDMTYSIAWGLFSLGLLGIGIFKRIPVPRYAAIGLLAVTLLKVFFHDLARIQSIYRIGALIGVAIVAFITSYLYQKYVSRLIEK